MRKNVTTFPTLVNKFLKNKKKVFSKSYFFTSEIKSFQTQNTIRKVAIKTAVGEPYKRLNDYLIL